MNKFLITLIIITIGICSNAQSPSRTFNPYSQEAIGDLKSDYYARNFGIANIGIANHDKYSVNMTNPALLEKNKFTVFDVNLGYNVDQLSIDTSINTQSGGGFKSLTVVMPISYKWSTGFSLTPISEIAYYASGISTVGVDTITNTEIATGGIQRVGWSNGFNIKKGLNLGFGLGYNFGNKINYNETVLTSGTSRTDRQTLTSKINGVDYELGVSYSTVIKLTRPDTTQTFETETLYLLKNKKVKSLQKLDSNGLANLDTLIRRIGKKQRKLSIDLGGVYSNALEWNKQNYLSDQYILSTTTGDVNYGYQDTTENSIQMPSGFGFGITIGNASDTSQWKLSLETTVKNWSEYSEDGISINLPDAMRMAAGFEYTPFINYYDGGLKGILSRATYKIGGYRTTTPYEINNTQIEEVGMHFGISFIERPKRIGNTSVRWEKQDKKAGYNKSRNYLSRLNVGIAVGKLGMNEATAIQQMFFKVNVGISLNSEWFVRSKIN